MPSTPIRQLVLDGVKSALENIVAGDDYFFTVAKVYAFSKRVPDMQNFPGIVIFAGNEEKDQSLNFNQYRCSLDMTLVAMISEGDDAEKPDEVSDLLHDIEKSLMADHTLGGVASDVMIKGNQVLVAEDETRVGVVVNVTVEYRHAIKDPSSLSCSS